MLAKVFENYLNRPVREISSEDEKIIDEIKKNGKKQGVPLLFDFESKKFTLYRISKFCSHKRPNRQHRLIHYDVILDGRIHSPVFYKSRL